jgi:hypothetical protein
VSSDDIVKIGIVGAVSNEVLAANRGFFEEMMAEQRRRAALQPWERELEDEHRQIEQDNRRREAKARVAAIHNRARFIAGGSPTVVAVLDLHAPVVNDWGDVRCHGCDAEGYETELPSWPCRTYDLITSKQPTN